MSFDELVIRGAKQNNLKNLTLTLPHDRVIVVTGVSGSGKSTLAFETVFAEGQWRFIESLSTYARLFLEKLDRPDVDAIENIRPAIALEQRNPVRGSRSTVGTLTELYDYLRLLYAKVSTPYCPHCGKEVRSWDPSAVVAHLAEHYGGAKALVVFRSEDDRAALKRKGFHRLLKDGVALPIDEAGSLKPPYDVVLDRLVVRNEPRLADSIEMAMREGRGNMTIMIIDGPELRFGTGLRCDDCDAAFVDPTPLLFSFNHPVGACPECKGFGNVLLYDESLIIPDPELSIAEGAIEPWEKPVSLWWKKQLLKAAKSLGIPTRTPFKDLSAEHKKMLYKGAKGFYGIDDFFEELEGKRYKLHVRVFLSRYRKGHICTACGGKRLRPEALAFRIGELDIADMCGKPVSDLRTIFSEPDLSPHQREIAKEILRQIDRKLDFLDRVGLGYLTPMREGKTLSGGEFQRVNLSNQLASRLTGTIYVLDEPTVGLHKRDTERVAEIMAELAEIGNTVMVVEHDTDIIRASDWVVELGPAGGEDGGNLIFSGPRDEFIESNTLTARYVNGRAATASRRIRRRSKRSVVIEGATGNNLKNARLSVPLGTLTVVTGVSGSGKSTLVVETLYNALARELKVEMESPLPFKKLHGHDQLSSVKLIDQAPIGRTPRSNPVTYLKIFDPIRKVFSDTPEARANGYGPGFFSFNVEGGRCPACKGEGYQKLEMYFFEDLYVKCEVCDGKRFGPDALSIKYLGKDIHEVLQLTVDEAIRLFSAHRQVRTRLELLSDVGLGYLRLGQPATTLSGGEAQRLKICAELGSGRVSDVLFILDEPTVGLHPKDIGELLDVLNRLVDAGNTVLVIEHNLDVVMAADWVIDLGPEGGEAGGEVIFEGSPEKLSQCKRSYTGHYMKGRFA